jgi:putative sporulation protein YtxC
MKLLTVGLTGVTDEIKNKLEQSCFAFAQDGFRVAIEETYKGDYTFLGCNINEGEMSFRNYERIKNMVKKYVSKILADLIMFKDEKKIVKKLVDSNYCYFNEDERQIIYNNAIKILNDTCNDFNFATRREFVQTKINDYLDSHHELVLEGFINFRLKDYREKLSQLVDRTVDDFMMDVEYKEFIRVLKYFVDIQEPLIEQVHVVIGAENSFKILDTNGDPINNQYLENFIFQSPDEINYEDLVISSLIAIAPYSVMLHGVVNDTAQNIIDTVKNVFEGRVVMCGGCDICSKNSFV